MYITLRNDERVIVESTKHKIKIHADRRGDMSFDYNEKNTNISDALMKDVLDKKEAEYTKSGWVKDSFQQSRKYLDEMLDRVSKKLRVDKNKLFHLMLERQDYSFVNYFQNCNYLPFADIDKLREELGNLQKSSREATTKLKEKIVSLQKKITDLQKIKVNKVEVEGSTYMDYNINVNCPFCDRYQEVEDTDDWHPGEEFEGNQECGSCGKIFSVKSDGEY